MRTVLIAAVVGFIVAILTYLAVDSLTQEPYNTPPSCIVVMEINAHAFDLLGRGDIDGYIDFQQQSLETLREAAQDCRSHSATSI